MVIEILLVVFTPKNLETSLKVSTDKIIFDKCKSVNGAKKQCRPKAIAPSLPGRIKFLVSSLKISTVFEILLIDLHYKWC